MAHEETLDVLAYLRRLAKHLVPALVAGIVVAGALIGLGMAKGSSTMYTQKAHVLVYPNAVTTDAQAMQQETMLPMMMRSYVALEDSPVFIDEVARQMGQPWTPDTVAQDLTITWGGGSNLLAFQATGTSLDETNKLASTAADVFVKKASTMAPVTADSWKPTLTVVQRDVEQTPPTSTATSLMMGIAAGLGTFLVALLVLEAISARRGRNA